VLLCFALWAHKIIEFFEIVEIVEIIEIIEVIEIIETTYLQKSMFLDE
jgi:hypothetical protein